MRPQAHSSSRFLFASAIAALALAGCGGAGGGFEDDGGTELLDAGGETDRPDASTAGQLGSPCQRATQCHGELVCDPETNLCADSVACSEHSDCGQGAHCADDDQCAQSGDVSPCADDDNCGPSDDCIGGFCGCRGEVFEAELVDVNMLILLDRSGSMARDLAGDQVNARCPDSRWCIARTALDSLLTAYEELIHFGFAVYPHSSFTSGSISCNDPSHASCQAGNLLEDLQISGKTTILDAFDGTSPYGCTPSGQSLAAAAAAASFTDDEAENVILYITDGEENCGSNQEEAAADLLATGIRTFVVGFSDDIGLDELNATAEAGGTAREDADGLKFYLATDAETLQDSLDTIAGEALSCTYDLGGVPTEPDNLHVYADRQSVIRDREHGNGWDYDSDANQVTFYGPACDDLRTGGIEELAIVQTCDLVID